MGFHQVVHVSPTAFASDCHTTAVGHAGKCGKCLSFSSSERVLLYHHCGVYEVLRYTLVYTVHIYIYFPSKRLCFPCGF